MSLLIQPDGTPVESTEPTTPPTEAEAALNKLVEISGGDFDRGQAETLKAKLAKLRDAAKAQQEQVEDVIGTETAKSQDIEKSPGTPGVDRPLTGKDVDWSEYDLNFNVRHLYRDAVYRMTPEGPKWLAIVTDFLSTTKDFKQYDVRVNKPGSKDKEDQEFLNLGQYLNDKVNGPERWKLEVAMPAMGGQMGLLLSRQIPLALPDPVRLQTEEVVEAPKDPELQAVEDAALAFAAGEGLAPIEPLEIPLDEAGVMGEDTTTPVTSLRAIEKGTPEYEQARAQLDEKGALEARSGAGVSAAVATAAAETVAAPQAGFETPDPVSNPFLGGGLVPAAGYNAAADILAALNGPDFGSLEAPKE